MSTVTVVRGDGLETKLTWSIVRKGHSEAWAQVGRNKMRVSVLNQGRRCWAGYIDGMLQPKTSTTKYDAQREITDTVHRMIVRATPLSSRTRESPSDLYSPGRTVSDLYKELQSVHERKKRILTQLGILERHQFELEVKLAKLAGVRVE